MLAMTSVLFSIGLASCNFKSNTGYADYGEKARYSETNNKQDYLTEIKPDSPLNQAQIINDFNNEEEIFKPILEAYAELESSGYTKFDENLIGDSLLVDKNEKEYNFPAKDRLILSYSFYDINSDGLEELIIGADESISGIYSLQSGTPTSIIQVQFKYNLSLLNGSDNNCVIEHSSGRMGSAVESYYSIDKDGKLSILNVLYTTGDIMEDDELVGHYRAKDVLGEKNSITEEEYCDLIQKYGSAGYELFCNIATESIIKLKWNYI